MPAYYNEYNKQSADWLRELINMGAIADGYVDERSIEDVEPSDLIGFEQHHFFAGIGTWSYALRNAGWPDNKPVCTASLPCQPFSVAGKQKGKEDERHLLPHFMQLVKECGFDTIFGEQVASAIKHGWLDDLQTNMEKEGYAVGHCVLGAHSVNAAHQRQRLFWVANAYISRQQRSGEMARPIDTETHRKGKEHRAINADSFNIIGMGNAKHDGLPAGEKPKCNEKTILNSEKEQICSNKSERAGSPAFISSITSETDWIYCQDDKYRPIKSGIKPLVDGLTRGMVYSGGEIDANNTGLARKIRLKGYGDAINADVATVFIRSFLDVAENNNA